VWLSGRVFRTMIVLVLFLASIALMLAWWTVRPAPPKSIVLSAGAAGGAYLTFARRYAEILARDGETVEVRTSQGSIENLRRLRLPHCDPEAADIAFLQSGTVPEESTPVSSDWTTCTTSPHGSSRAARRVISKSLVWRATCQRGSTRERQPCTGPEFAARVGD
jgi:hypothetical protein